MATTSTGQSRDPERLPPTLHAALPTLLAALLALAAGLLLFLSTGHDDAYITFWSAHALLELGEIVNYGGARVEQSSSLLHTLWLALAAGLTRQPVPVAGYWTGVAFGLLAMFRAQALCARLGWGSPPWLPFLIGTLPIFLYWWFGGLETTLAAWLTVEVAIVACDLLAGRKRWRSPSVVALTAAYLMVRPESFLVLLCALAAWLILARLLAPSRGTHPQPGTRTLRRWTLGVAGLFLLLALFRLAYFGQVFPQPVYAKVGGGGSGTLLAGLHYYLKAALLRPYAASFFAALVAAAVLGLRILRRREPADGRLFVLLLLGSNAAFVLAAGGDWMRGGRFFAPFVPLALVAGAGALRELAPGRRVALAVLTLALCANTAGSLALALGEASGRPLWRFLEIDPALRAQGTESFHWSERANRVRTRDILFVGAMNRVVDELLAKSERVTILSRQAGMVMFYVAKQNFGRIGFIDAYGLTTPEANEVADSLGAGRRSTGTQISPPRLIEALERERGRQARPDVVFDIYPTGPELAELGFETVYEQSGSVPGIALQPRAPGPLRGRLQRVRVRRRRRSLGGSVSGAPETPALERRPSACWQRGGPAVTGSLPSPRSRAGLARLTAFFFALLLLLNLLDGFAFFRVVAYQASRADTETPLTFAAVYAGAYLIALLGLVVLLAHANRVIRWTSWAGSALCVALFLGFESVNGYGFTYHEASLIWTEVDFIPDALRFFAASYLPPVLASFVALWLLARVVRSQVPRIPWLTACLIPLAGVWVNDRVLDLTYSKVFQSPVPYRVPLLANYARQHRMPYYGKREAPRIAPARAPSVDHIVLLMDESISGDRLGVNGGRKETTPYLAGIQDRLFNYGVASSISNLSSSTNLVLQAGVRPDQLPDGAMRSLKNPNVFSYLQAAGFSVFLLDNQIYSGRPNNLMTHFDLDQLDGHWQLRAEAGALAEYEFDRHAIDRVERIIRENARSFTYLIKVGAHFPYDEKYPEQETVFRPTLSDGGDGGNLEKTLNSYDNALRWSVDGFIRALFERFESSEQRILMIYTADHGQSLADAVEDDGLPLAGRPARWPHGMPANPPPQQAAVPLFLFGFGDGMQELLRGLFLPGLRDRVSQFELFPSLLQLAGYAYPEIRAHYHHSLFDPAPARDRRTFVSGNLFEIGGGFYNHELVQSSCYINEFDTP